METIPGRSGEADMDDQVPRSDVKTKVGSPRSSINVGMKEEVATPTGLQSFSHTGMVEETFAQGSKSFQQINVTPSSRQENPDYGNGGAHQKRDIKALVDKPFPVALYKIDMTLRTFSELMTDSSTPDNTERQSDLSLGLVDMKHRSDTDSSNTTHTDYSNIKHAESIHGEKAYRCTLCSHSCVHQSNFRKHMQSHTGEKPYKCSLCSYRCAQKGSLIRHQNIHTGEKPYKCSLCSYICSQKCHLKEHQMIHAGEKPYKCSFCSHSSSRKRNLQKHLKTHW